MSCDINRQYSHGLQGYFKYIKLTFHAVYVFLAAMITIIYVYKENFTGLAFGWLSAIHLEPSVWLLLLFILFFVGPFLYIIVRLRQISRIFLLQSVLENAREAGQSSHLNQDNREERGK